MRKTYCDRCGRECKDNESVTMNGRIELYENETKSYDLCHACFIGLRQYISGWEVYVKDKEKK